VREVEVEGREREGPQVTVEPEPLRALLATGQQAPSLYQLGAGGMGGNTILRVWGTKECCERSDQENILYVPDL